MSFKQGTRKQQDTYLDKIEGMVFGDLSSQVRRGSKFYHGPLNLYLAAPDSWESCLNALFLVLPMSILQMTLEDLNFKETPEEYIRDRNQYYSNKLSTSTV